MTRKHLQSLISAGVFSAALLSGAAYADDAKKSPAPEQTKKQETPASVSDAPSAKDDVIPSTPTPKGFFQHGCAGAGGCGGK